MSSCQDNEIRRLVGRVEGLEREQEKVRFEKEAGEKEKEQLIKQLNDKEQQIKQLNETRNNQANTAANIAANSSELEKKIR